MKQDGTLFVAEVLSRFEDVNQFADQFMSLAGFEKLKLQKLKDFFYVMVFKKVKEPSEHAAQRMNRMVQDQLLKPCIYKRR